VLRRAARAQDGPPRRRPLHPVADINVAEVVRYARRPELLTRRRKVKAGRRCREARFQEDVGRTREGPGLTPPGEPDFRIRRPPPND
jgi:hypothetical protein